MPHILIADDEPDICVLLEIQMEALGHTYVSAADGLQALDALSTHEFDLAILDVSMPHYTGIQVVEQVRALDPDRHLPIILLSALSGAEDIRRGLDAGATVYLTKPTSMADLRTQVSALLGDSPWTTTA